MGMAPHSLLWKEYGGSFWWGEGKAAEAWGLSIYPPYTAEVKIVYSYMSISPYPHRTSYGILRNGL